MYKTRIHNWHLDKKNKEDEMLALFRRIKERDSRGLKSRFLVRRRVVTSEDVYQYLRRKGIGWTAIPLAAAEDSAVWARNDIVCYTPGNSPVIRPAAGKSAVDEELSLAATAQIPAVPGPAYLDTASTNFLRSIQMYYATMFGPGGWDLSDKSRPNTPLKFGGEFLKFHNLVTLKRQDEAFKVLDVAFGNVRALLQTGHPRLLVYLLECIAFSRSVGHEHVARSLIEFFTRMAAQVLDPMHPITVFASSLRQTIDGATLDGFVEVALQCMAEQFLTHIGGRHDETMGLLLASASILKHQRSYYMASARLDQLLILYEQAFGPRSYQASHALADHAVVKTEMGDFGDAMALMLEAMHRAEGIADPKEKTESQVRNLMNLSTLRLAEGDVPQMVESLKLALRISEDGLEEEHWMIRHVSAMLAAAPPLPEPWTEVSPPARPGPTPVSGSSSSEEGIILTPSSDPPE